MQYSPNTSKTMCRSRASKPSQKCFFPRVQSLSQIWSCSAEANSIFCANGRVNGHFGNRFTGGSYHIYKAYVAAMFKGIFWPKRWLLGFWNSHWFGVFRIFGSLLKVPSCYCQLLLDFRSRLSLWHKRQHVFLHWGHFNRGISPSCRAGCSPWHGCASFSAHHSASKVRLHTNLKRRHPVNAGIPW